LIFSNSAEIGVWCILGDFFGGHGIRGQPSQQLCPFLPLQFEIDASLVLINSDKYVFNFGWLSNHNSEDFILSRAYFEFDSTGCVRYIL